MNIWFGNILFLAVPIQDPQSNGTPLVEATGVHKLRLPEVETSTRDHSQSEPENVPSTSKDQGTGGQNYGNGAVHTKPQGILISKII